MGAPAPIFWCAVPPRGPCEGPFLGVKHCSLREGALSLLRGRFGIPWLCWFGDGASGMPERPKPSCSMWYKASSKLHVMPCRSMALGPGALQSTFGDWMSIPRFPFREDLSSTADCPPFTHCVSWTTSSESNFSSSRTRMFRPPSPVEGLAICLNILFRNIHRLGVIKPTSPSTPPQGHTTSTLVFNSPSCFVKSSTAPFNSDRKYSNTEWGTHEEQYCGHMPSYNCPWPSTLQFSNPCITTSFRQLTNCLMHEIHNIQRLLGTLTSRILDDHLVVWGSKFWHPPPCYLPPSRSLHYCRRWYEEVPTPPLPRSEKCHPTTTCTLRINHTMFQKTRRRWRHDQQNYTKCQKGLTCMQQKDVQSPYASTNLSLVYCHCAKGCQHMTSHAPSFRKLPGPQGSSKI